MSSHPKYSHYNLLRDKWGKRHVDIQNSFVTKHKNALESFKEKTKKFAVGATSVLALTTLPPTPQLLPFVTPTVFPQDIADGNNKIDKSVFLLADLQNELPENVRSLSDVENDLVATTLSRHFGLGVKAELEEKRLNRTYGYIGQEQHLMRFPGDTINGHFDSSSEASEFSKYGMAPGRGAYGYFASPEGLTEKDKQKEKWYIAVQTFLAPGYYDKTREMVNFFKFRKMLVVNPQNGKAVVAVIGDAGPAEWTGKHLGGSPEVMKYLERVDGRQKGPVLYFFVEDPNDVVPLGPIHIQ